MTEAEAKEIISRYEALLDRQVEAQGWSLDDDEIVSLFVDRRGRVWIERASLEPEQDYEGNPAPSSLSRWTVPAKF